MYLLGWYILTDETCYAHGLKPKIVLNYVIVAVHVVTRRVHIPRASECSHSRGFAVTVCGPLGIEYLGKRGRKKPCCISSLSTNVISSGFKHQFLNKVKHNSLFLHHHSFPKS